MFLSDSTTRYFITSCEKVTNSNLDFCCSSASVDDSDSSCCRNETRRFQLSSVGNPVRTLGDDAPTAGRQTSSSSTKSTSFLVQSASSSSVSLISTTSTQSDSRLETDTSRATNPSFTSSLSQSSFTSSSLRTLFISSSFQFSFTSFPSQPSFVSVFSQPSPSTSISTLATGAKVGIGVGGVLGFIFMILSSILF